MTVSISKMSVEYYLQSVAVGDAAPAGTGSRDLTAYYTASGAPPGRWLGAGLAGLNLTEGQRVTARGARRLLEHAQNPVTGDQLGRAPIKASAAPAGAKTPAGKAAGPQRQPVAGFDLTCSVPKSVSVLWALADEPTQAKIHAAHRAAVSSTVSWLETNVIQSRSGPGGVAHVPVHGVAATAFDHWDSRAGDPQLHTHVVIANRVQRVADGKWVTLDSYTLHRNVVAASERFNATLFDELARTLGTQTEVRAKPSRVTDGDHGTPATELSAGDSPLPIAQGGARVELAGIPDELIAEFSTRSHDIEAQVDRLVEQWTQTHGQPPTGHDLAQIRQTATLATRDRKSDAMTSLVEKAAAWRTRAQGLGHDPAAVVAATLDRDPTLLQAATVHPETADQIAGRVIATLGARHTTFAVTNIHAEASRALALVRTIRDEDRDALLTRVVDAAIDQAVSLSPTRYGTPVESHSGLSVHGRHAFDHDRRFSTQEIVSAEARLIAAATTMNGPTIKDHDRVQELLDEVTIAGGHKLAADQSQAAFEILTSRQSLTGIVGPAGAGKTAALAGIRKVWEDTHGPGSVVGLAPSAAAAAVLAKDLEIPTDNVAKWLWETTGPGAQQRAQRLAAARTEFEATPASDTARRSRLNTIITGLESTADRYHMNPGQLIIVDEASMAGTHALDQLRGQAQEAGAKVVVVGDPLQLGSIDAGGILGWMDRHHDAEGVASARLTSLWRFKESWEASNSTRLRAGDTNAIKTLVEQGRVLGAASEDDVESIAFNRWVMAEEAGETSLLIAGSLPAVDRLNARVQAARLETGAVDHSTTVALSNGVKAGVGDSVLTRRNDRRITDEAGGFVKNGDLFTISDINDDGSLTAARATGEVVTLTPETLSTAQLGYASTAYRAQGVTVDRGIAAIDPDNTSREQFYVALTRGRLSNHAVLPPPEEPPSPDPWHMLHEITPKSLMQQLQTVMTRTDTELTAHEVQDHEHGWATDLARFKDEAGYLTYAIGTRRATQWVTNTHGHQALDAWVTSPQWNSIIQHASRAALPDQAPQDPATAAEDLARHGPAATTIHGVLDVPVPTSAEEQRTLTRLLEHVQRRLDQLEAQTRTEPWRAELIGAPCDVLDAALLTRAALNYTGEALMPRRDDCPDRRSLQALEAFEQLQASRHTTASPPPDVAFVPPPPHQTPGPVQDAVQVTGPTGASWTR
ncbi:MobF family relaxase [Kocuria sp. ZOR0020]|uniref:MobF family relaxase n=1 Tax=Kocuria sp. ZOR0020 TaxID=1339234 RepID=UPI000646C082|nr:MobF family relaxase [Kocuria sp. ZOR0020]